MRVRGQTGTLYNNIYGHPRARKSALQGGPCACRPEARQFIQALKSVGHSVAGLSGAQRGMELAPAATRNWDLTVLGLDSCWPEGTW